MNILISKYLNIKVYLCERDKIEFDSGFCYEKLDDQIIYITENLTFLGSINIDENGKRLFNNTIKCKFVIKNGAEVVFKNLWLESAGMGNVFVVEDASTLNLETVVVEDKVEGQKYAAIYIKGKSTINLDDVEIQESDSNQLIICEENSFLNVVNSDYFYCRLNIKNSVATIKNSNLISEKGNVINISNDSNVSIENSTITSLATINEENVTYPAIWVDNSQLKTNNCNVFHEECVCAINCIKSLYFSSNDTIASVELAKSSGYFDNTRI